jgi:hypothetical protein
MLVNIEPQEIVRRSEKAVMIHVANENVPITEPFEKKYHTEWLPLFAITLSTCRRFVIAAEERFVKEKNLPLEFERIENFFERENLWYIRTTRSYYKVEKANVQKPYFGNKFDKNGYEEISEDLYNEIQEEI